MRIVAAVLTVFFMGAQTPVPNAPDPAAQWLQRLRSADDAARLDVAYDLTPLVGNARDGEAARTARSARSAAIIVSALSDRDAGVRGYVADALGELAAMRDPLAQALVVRALVAALGTGVDREGVALTKFPDRIVVPALVARLRERARAIRPQPVAQPGDCFEFEPDDTSDEIAFVLAQIGAASAPALDAFLDEGLTNNLYAATFPLVSTGTPQTASILAKHLRRAGDVAFGHLVRALASHPSKQRALALLTAERNTETNPARQQLIEKSMSSIRKDLAAPPESPEDTRTANELIAAPTSAQLDTVRALLARHDARSDDAVRDVLRWGSAARALAPDLESFIAADVDSGSLYYAMIALAIADQPPEPAAIKTLVRVAKNGRYAYDRIAAMDALSRFGHGPQEVGPAFRALAWTYIVQDVDSVQRHIYSHGFYTNAAHRCYGRAGGHRIGGDPLDIPTFAWPPPPYSTGDAVNRRFFKGDAATLSDVFSRLKTALAAAGFRDNGLYQIPGGFALATRLQQTNSTWDPLASEHQWDREQAPPGNLGEYVSQLFRRPPGQFRLVVFAVTDRNVVPDVMKTLSQEDAALLATRGAIGDLPAALGNRSFKGHNCFALVYAFTKRYGQAQTVIPSTLDMQTHLTKAKIWPKLAGGS